MDHAEFDHFVDEYREQHRTNISITGEGPEFFAAYKIRVLAEIAHRKRVQVNTILDFGSGIGNSIPYLSGHFPNARLVCADVSQRSLDLAESRFPGGSEPVLIKGQVLPLESEAFDLAFSACVFHHIPHDEHVAWLRELLRVTRPGGILVIFEHNPFNPLTLRAVNTCPFDVNAKLIKPAAFMSAFHEAGWRDTGVDFQIFFPRALSLLRPLERYLTRVPFGAQYCVLARKAG